MKSLRFDTHGVTYLTDTSGKPFAACSHGSVARQPKPVQITVKRRRSQTPLERIQGLFA